LVRPVFVGWMIAAFPIGWLVSKVLTAALFFTVFTPIALIFRLLGRDALMLRRDPDRPTYWTPKPPTTDPRRYLREF
jgi:Saxitoxin biosynthesis operon protein SxtJ